jgi:hypothetical protein
VDVQLYDTYFVLPWYAWLPIVLTMILAGLLVAISRIGSRRLYFITVCVALSLLLSLSQWMSIAATITVTLTRNSSDKAPSLAQTDQGWLNNLGPFILAYQVIIAGIILVLSWRMSKHVSKQHPG